MGRVVLQNKAQSALDYLRKYEIAEFKKLATELKNLQEFGRNRPKLKNIGSGIKRFRVGRRRVLCTSNQDIYVRIIAIEKDTSKDYKQRKNYILKSIDH